MTPFEFAHRIAVVESNNNPNAPLGDDGRALGRFQVHPDWLFDWSTNYHITPHLMETWDSFVIRVVEAFYQSHTTMMDVEIAMYFHLGHPCKSTDSDWDKDYAERFTTAS